MICFTALCFSLGKGNQDALEMRAICVFSAHGVLAFSYLLTILPEFLLTESEYTS